MMKTITRLFFVAVLLTVSYVSQAQLYLGGMISGAYTQSARASTRSWAVDMSPEVGVAFSDRWAVGVRMSYGISSSEADSPSLNDSKISSTPFDIYPYFAFAPLRVNKLALWAEVGMQLLPKLENADFRTYAGYITPVLTYDVSEHVSLKANLDCAGLSVIGSTDGTLVIAGLIGGEDAITFDEDLSIGVVFRF